MQPEVTVITLTKQHRLIRNPVLAALSVNLCYCACMNEHGVANPQPHSSNTRTNPEEASIFPRLITRNGTPITKALHNCIHALPVDPKQPVKQMPFYGFHWVEVNYAEMDNPELEMYPREWYGEEVFLCKNGEAHLSGDLLIEDRNGNRTQYHPQKPRFNNPREAALEILTWLVHLDNGEEAPPTRERVRERLHALANDYHVEDQVRQMYALLGGPLPPPRKPLT